MERPGSGMRPKPSSPVLLIWFLLASDLLSESVWGLRANPSASSSDFCVCKTKPLHGEDQREHCKLGSLRGASCG